MFKFCRDGVLQRIFCFAEVLSFAEMEFSGEIELCGVFEFCGLCVLRSFSSSAEM